MKTSFSIFINTTLVLLLFVSFTAPALAIQPYKSQTQYILEVSWMNSSNYWYVYVIQYDKDPATLSLEVFNSGAPAFSVDKVLTTNDNYQWNPKHTLLSVTFDYNGSPQKMDIEFWATEKPSRDKGIKGDFITAAGEAEVNFLGDTVAGVSGTVISWCEPKQ